MPDQLIKLPGVSTEVTIASEWFAERDKLVAEAGAVQTVECAEAFETAGDALKRITKTSNALETMRKDFARPFTQAAKIIKAASDQARKPLEDAKSDLRGKLAVYAEAEAERARAEAEDAERLAREDAERQLAEAEEAAALFGEDVTDLFKMENAPRKPTRFTPTADGVRVGKRVEFAVVDASAVPIAFWRVDESKIRAWLAANQERVMHATDAERAKLIPGVAVRVETTVTSR